MTLPFRRPRLLLLLFIGSTLIAACQSTGERTAETPGPTDTSSTTLEPTTSTTIATPTTATATTDSAATTTAAVTTVGEPDPADVSAIDWWACWRAEDALDTRGRSPADGSTAATLANCATGPSSIGSLGDMSQSSNPPIYRAAGAAGHPSIEFTYAGDTLLQTNGGRPWPDEAVLPSAVEGVTLAWVGMMTDVDSHDVKYLVSGLGPDQEYPMLMVEGEGLDRFAGYGGGNVEARSTAGTVVDFSLHGVLMYLAAEGSESVLEVDETGGNAGQDSRMRLDVTGLTLGNIFSRGFSTTDHQFVFLGLHEGALSDADKAVFWKFVNDL